MKHRRSFSDYLEQFVYGAIDGTVTTFAVVAGSTGANLTSKIVLILGLANLIADGFSMGVSAYLSKHSENNRLRLIEKVKKITHTGHADKDSLTVGLATFAAFVLAGAVPLSVYLIDLVWHIEWLFLWSALLTAATFVTIGYLKGRLTAQHTLHSVVETLLLGGIAAALAYYLGFFLENTLT